MMNDDWIPDLEIENADVKWAWSYFDGRAEGFNNEGDYNFQVRIPEERVQELRDLGWNIKSFEPRDEGDPFEHLLKVNISFRFEEPKIFLIKQRTNGEKVKFRVSSPRDLHDIKRPVTERVDVIIKPSRWSQANGRSGISAYVKELYVTIRESRFASDYGDIPEM